MVTLWKSANAAQAPITFNVITRLCYTNRRHLKRRVSHAQPAPGILVPVNCPYCKIPSMAGVRPGEVEVDRCRTCGAVWFDPGEIRELTQGRLAAEEGDAPGTDPSSPAKED